MTVSGGGENSGSVQSLRRGVEQATDDADARLRLGTVLAESGQPAEALVHLQRSVELNPALV